MYQGFALIVIGGLIGWAGKYVNDLFQRQELFDHRLRIEKEYQIYTELWEKLFEFRIAAHGLVDDISEAAEWKDPSDQFFASLNKFQAIVRRNEPFIHESILTPSDAIVLNGRAIANASNRVARLDEYRVKIRNPEAEEKVVEKKAATRESQRDAVKEIDEQFPKVCETIRKRMSRRFTIIG